MTQRPNDARTAKLFKNGSSQAVRLPADFRFDGDEVYIWRDELTGTVVLSPRKRTTWADFQATRAEFSDRDLDTFMVERQQPPDQLRSPLTDEDGA